MHCGGNDIEAKMPMCHCDSGPIADATAFEAIYFQNGHTCVASVSIEASGSKRACNIQDAISCFMVGYYLVRILTMCSTHSEAKMPCEPVANAEECEMLDILINA